MSSYAGSTINAEPPSHSRHYLISTVTFLRRPRADLGNFTRKTPFFVGGVRLVGFNCIRRWNRPLKTSVGAFGHTVLSLGALGFKVLISLNRPGNRGGC